MTCVINALNYNALTQSDVSLGQEYLFAKDRWGSIRGNLSLLLNFRLVTEITIWFK